MGTRRGSAALWLVLVMACNGGSSSHPSSDQDSRPSSGPTVATKVTGTIERFEQEQQRALDANRESAQTTLPADLTPVGLKAAAQRHFAQIWWSVRYPHGQHATPHVDVEGRIIRCRVELSGTPEPDAGTDWTSFETKIDNLPPAKYQIVAPIREVTLVVPEVFVP